MIVVIFFLFLSVLFVFSVVRMDVNSRFSQVTNTLSRKNALTYKFPSGNRFDYLRQGLLSIADKPLLGVGPGNFVLASKKFKTNTYWTETSHNIFLEMIVENGIPAGIVFILIVFELFRRSEKNLYFYLSLALLFNFQIDYAYRIFSLLFLFFVLLGISYKKRPLASDR